MNYTRLRDRLRTAGVVNPYEFYGSQPYIYRRVAVPRSVTSAGWMVRKRGRDLAPKGAWYDYGSKRFGYGGRDQEASALAAAQAWASSEFGVAAWARDPFGCYGSAEFVRRRVDELLEKGE